MTRKEAIKTLKENLCGLCAYGSQNMESCDIRSCDNRDAIKALEQEPILDKIKAEIAEYEEEVFHRTKDYSDYAVVRHCLDITNKYLAESENKECI